MAKKDKPKTAKKKQHKKKSRKALNDNDLAQAQIMGMALAGLKAAEVNAQLIVKQAAAIEALQAQMLSQQKILAHYTVAADQAKTKLEDYPEGSLEHEAMLLMSRELYQVAGMLQGMNNKNGESNEPATNP
ncbi:MAG: hypothetical protein R3F02_18755 [Thiolinea sp.]